MNVAKAEEIFLKKVINLLLSFICVARRKALESARNNKKVSVEWETIEKMKARKNSFKHVNFHCFQLPLSLSPPLYLLNRWLIISMW